MILQEMIIDDLARPTLRLLLSMRKRRSVDDEELFTTAEATRYLKLDDPGRMRDIARRLGIGRKIGGNWTFTKRELDAYHATRLSLPYGTQRMRGYRVTVPPDPLGDAIAQGELLDATAAAEILGVSRQRMYELAEQGRLGTYHGRRPLFTKAEVEAHKATRNRKGGRPRKPTSE